LATREFGVHTSPTGEIFFVLFHCHFTLPSIEGQEGVNDFSKKSYVAPVDTRQTMHKVSSPVGQNRGESFIGGRDDRV